MSLYAVDKLIAEARRLAADYRRATGKTLPISQEIAVNDAIRLLDLQPAPAGAIGYDAIRDDGGQPLHVQVKGRVIFETQKGGQRIGQLAREQDWDLTVLVLMDDAYEPFEIYQADREALEEALRDQTDNRKGQISVRKFQNIGTLIWTRDQGRAVR
jgi:hypothetical protein